MLIDYKNVNVNQENQAVLTNVTFQVKEGDFVYIIGKVGAGKSSLLKTIYCELDHDHPEKAEVLGVDISNIKRKDVPALRKQMGIIFQDFQLLHDRTVRRNLEFVLKATGWKSRKERTERIEAVLEKVGMLDKLDKMPHELSGGEQQHIAIARALLNEPKIIIADEPTGNLDLETARHIVSLLQDISKRGTSVVMTTHNIPSDGPDRRQQSRINQRKKDEDMKVMKFGGTSVGSPERIKKVAGLVTRSGEPTFLVLSAMSGTTNTLLEISDYLFKKNPDGANETINQLERKYLSHAEELYTNEDYKKETIQFMHEEFDYLRSFTKDLFTSFEQKSIVAQGEILSTHMMYNYMQEQGIDCVLLSALDFMRTDKNAEPDSQYIRKKLNALMDANDGHQVYITQGFICRNTYGEVDNLLRGGSDYTASLIGAAIDAEEIQIWTDIDGMHNNDPRVVEKTESVKRLNFEEAAELAYFGAKILHPTCIQPAKFAGIPVRLLSTLDPDADGTIIDNVTMRGTIKAIAAKDDIIAIKIKSSRMLLATGFLRKVFEIFESYQTPIDMVCTSEVGVSVTIDNGSHLQEIVDELKKYGTVTVDNDMCIICIVGDLDWSNLGFETLATEAMKDIPVRMISYGGSNYNISFLVKEQDKKRALQNLSKEIFGH